MAFGRGQAPENIARGRDPRRSWKTLLLHTDGRIGSTTYAWTFAACALVWGGGRWAVEELLHQPGWVGLILTAPAAWAAVSLTAKRAHDSGLSGGIAGLLVFPYLRWVLAVLLLIAPTEPAWNKYGRPPKRLPKHNG